MKKVILLTGISLYSILIAFAQQTGQFEGGRFTKIIEYNVSIQGITESDHSYNLTNKSALDRIFFGERNSPVEYVLRTSFDGAYGLRMVKNRSNNFWQVEVMRLPDSEEIIKIVSAYENPVIIPGQLISSTSLTLKDMDIINEHNKKMVHAKQNGELYKPYCPESKKNQ